MNFIIVFFYIILSIYFILTICFIVGFLKIPVFNPEIFKPNSSAIKISLIIPFKNEEKNLPLLIDSLKKQSLENDLFEVILVNDHSHDNSPETARNLIKDTENFRLVCLPDNLKGKKNALISGIKISANELIVTSDADCTHPHKWLETIYCFYLKHNAKMIAAPVIMTGSNLFENLQATEFLSLTGATAGAFGIRHPVMCNGANLAYEKKVFFDFDDALNSAEESGDDVFLLHKIKKIYPEGIFYLKSADAAVYTEAEKSLKSFLKQRIRWASKSNSYTDFDTIFTAVTVLSANFVLVVSFFAAIYGYLGFGIPLSLFFIKFIPDSILLVLTANDFGEKKLLKFIPLTALIYPLYIIVTGVTGILKNGRVNVL
ncbi:MAG: glycosyltransferase [Chlorobi bacterium]|nr:glycosyltransferase [Chlorobiota bacterium]